MTAL
ncbi:unnamed protein product, partial [Didymodactylos carnosus]|jgi:hypothetical protein